MKNLFTLWTSIILKSYGWKSTDKIVRFDGNPIFTAKDVPYEADLIFNPGVVKYKGKYLMAFRDDFCAKGTKKLVGTHIGLATGEDGIKWTAKEKPFINDKEVRKGEVKRLYDPRLSVIDDELYMSFAMDTLHGLRGGIGKIDENLSRLEIISLSVPDNRNMTLFPEKINGQFYRLERPMPVYSRGREMFDIWISRSNDLKYWGESKLVLGQEAVPFSNCKIGPAAPPIKTDKGWLTVIHAVKKDRRLMKNGWERKWRKVYCAGIMLLDLEDPSKVLGVYNEPLLMPEADYELYNGFRNNAIFPCGLVPEEDGTVKLYYGAADIYVCLATAKINDLVELCLSQR